MKKTVKMCLYGNPGTGKSVFACKSPKPFFICTDGNYEWLDEFGAKEKDHVQVDSWAEAKKVFDQNFDEYETIVVDLVEDLFKFCENEFCIKNKLQHIGDLGYAKGYTITRDEFFIEICKLFAKDKNIILLSHGNQTVVKDRRGVEHTEYTPSSKIPDKLWDSIEGRCRYFLRCYLKGEQIGENEKNVVKRRYLSFIPKENEYGIIRGIDDSVVPQDIPLDWNEFANLIGLDKTTVSNTDKVEKAKKEVIENVKKQTKQEPVVEEPQVTEELVVEEKQEVEKPQAPVEQVKQDPQDKIAAIKAKLAAKSVASETKPVETKPVEQDQPIQQATQPVEQPKPISNADRVAAIKAKLAAMKAN